MEPHEPHNLNPGPGPDPSRVAVVVAGAGARGAYEAGVLSVVVPFLRAAGITPDLFIGTSAGAINATLFAAGAHLPADEQAAAALAVWRSVDIDDVFRPLMYSGPATIARWTGQLCGIPGIRLTSLVDTTPLARTAHRLVAWRQLAANLDDRRTSLAVVTTSAADNRTVVFVDRNGADPLPPPDANRAIDYRDVRVTAEHVRASAAIPALFPAVEVSTPNDARGWYADGGIRLNAPLKPALSLGAHKLVVVATHPAVYPPVPNTGEEPGPPDVDDMVVRVLDAALVDRMVEDLRTLGKINELVADGRRTGTTTTSMCPTCSSAPRRAVASAPSPPRHSTTGTGGRPAHGACFAIRTYFSWDDCSVATAPAAETSSATCSSTADSSTPQSVWDDGTHTCSWQAQTNHPGSPERRSTSRPSGSPSTPQCRRTAQESAPRPPTLPDRILICSHFPARSTSGAAVASRTVATNCASWPALTVMSSVP
ncbi:MULTISPECIES: patatin-like phospholipase family protein [Rhodococcus]|uniref:PNPLA domain-containing protein n=1 Tax=Rhodococcus opacus RKJ300 = JCM 13270 TaxID=1165867 RepID=I0WQZ5_RHOOP|nr:MULTISPECIES: patatin-like phospholipase family protein [Rhodococcus]EID78811.1 hypothetical protein W59_16474 [Rhodococcus opacus RKJ300 = JCM 13270]QQZ19485.1 patatin-like phospholipase family protein [Rhodococcus sp. 21391]